MSKFVVGADICLKGGERFAIDHFGLNDDIESAVTQRKPLHSSFSYYIYEVEEAVTKKLTRDFGMRRGTHCSGHKVIGKPICAFDHPAWGVEVESCAA